MTLIDFGHLSSRILHTAVGQGTPKVDKTTGKYNTDDWGSMYVHLLFKNLSYLKMKFEKDYGELVICIDSKDNWRKKVYPEYKAHRAKKRDESKIDYPTFYTLQNEVIEEIRANFPFKVVEVSEAEADDIVGVLAKKYSAFENTVVVSSDKDFKQVLEYGAKLFDPINKIFVNMASNELKEWKVDHILMGDDTDNIPNIMQGTEFTPEFRKFLADEGVFKDIPVHEFISMKMANSLFDKFDVYETVKSGKLKGQKKDTKLIYKTVPFGDKGRYLFTKDLKENLKKNPMYIENFKRNKELVLFEHIPEHISARIIDTYNTAESHFDTAGIMRLFSKYHLMELMKSVSDFFQTAPVQKHTAPKVSLSDWD
jgi:5'-3' exonuclease